MAVGWWENAPALVERSLVVNCERSGFSTYQFGLGRLALDCDDAPLNARFAQVYGEGAASEDRKGRPQFEVRCVVRTLDSPQVSVVRFDDPEPLDAPGFCEAIFADRGFRSQAMATPPWHAFWCGADDPLIALDNRHAVVDSTQVWQSFIASLAINRVLRLQHEMLFLHASSVVIGGHGVVMLGPKNSGKTTTALTLASRGHGFLGDETAALCLADGALLPFRRAASIRPGVRAARVDELLSGGCFDSEIFPDGGERVRARVGDLFPDAVATPAHLSRMIFLREFSRRPVAERFAFGLQHLRLLTPLAASMWNVSPGTRIMSIARLLRDIPCYHLDPGSPDETADLVEHIAGECN